MTLQTGLFEERVYLKEGLKIMLVVGQLKSVCQIALSLMLLAIEIGLLHCKYNSLLIIDDVILACSLKISHGMCTSGDQIDLITFKIICAFIYSTQKIVTLSSMVAK